MGVLRVGDLGEPAGRVERGPPVDGVGADAQRGPEPVPGHLHGPVEDLQRRPGGLLHPSLVRADPEVLRGLDEPDLRVVHVRERLGEEVRAGPEVGVEDDHVLAAGAGERVGEVPGLLVVTRVRPPDVGEPEGLAYLADLRPAGPVVQHVGAAQPRVGVGQLEYARPGVAQHLNRLAAHGQEDVHARVGAGLPCPDAQDMAAQVEAAAGEVHRQAHRLVDEKQPGVEQERQGDRIAHLEPHLRDDYAHRAERERHGQVRHGPPGVDRFFLFGRRFRQDDPVAAVSASGCDHGGHRRAPSRTHTSNGPWEPNAG